MMVVQLCDYKTIKLQTLIEWYMNYIFRRLFKSYSVVEFEVILFPSCYFMFSKFSTKRMFCFNNLKNDELGEQDFPWAFLVQTFVLPIKLILSFLTFYMSLIALFYYITWQSNKD